VTKPKERETGLSGFAVPIQVYSLIGSYVMATAEHREPYESRGSRTCLGARGGEIPPRDSTFSSDRPASDALGMSASLRSRPNLRIAAIRRGGRYCCKCPRLPGANFPAVKKSDRRPPIDVAPITLPRSPVSLSSGNEVPHIFTRKSRVQPKEILITSAKGLLQQNLPGADSCTATKPRRGRDASYLAPPAQIRT